MIEAGFSRDQAVAAINAVGATTLNEVPKAIKWQLEQGTAEKLAEASAAREVHTFDMMDFDGYALMWGDKHRTQTVDECGKKCLEWKPLPPSNFACNVCSRAYYGSHRRETSTFLMRANPSLPTGDR